ncbi:hypothetical protein GGI07_005339 [Coemansia sp. Benny D115]|nr:hypothetical protein GGI07_005339 [Coemansia sp. Benny D115]
MRCCFPAALGVLLPAMSGASGFKLPIFSTTPPLPSCPAHYTQWASTPHGPYSTGPLRLPSMRPAPECRTFRSAEVERVIANVSAQIGDADLRQLFGNVMPNTLDTAIAWHDDEAASGVPYTFVITGDINAQWTRDSTNQVMPLMPHLGADRALQALVAGLVNMQAEQISAYVFANAYKPPARAGLVPGENGWAKGDEVQPAFNASLVFEAKFEIDSLAAFFKLSAAYWRQTGGLELIDTPTWLAAVRQSLAVLERLQQPTYDEMRGGALGDAVVRFQRAAKQPTESCFGGGRGNPVRRTGMVRTLFRPSDDAATLPFFVPGNAMLAVELERLAQVLQSLDASSDATTTGGNSSSSIESGGVGGSSNERRLALRMAREIRDGIQRHAVVEHPDYGSVYAYEVDGYGGRLMMDDANVPSLLALPYLGFVSRSDPVYRNTRRMVLSAAGNPWYFEGTSLTGIGSPHTGFRRVWPMAVAMAALTSESSQEVREALHMLAASTGGLGLMHESVDADDPTSFSRPWFAWCNGVVSELITDTVRRFPGLI